MLKDEIHYTTAHAYTPGIPVPLLINEPGSPQAIYAQPTISLFNFEGGESQVGGFSSSGRAIPVFGATLSQSKY